MICLKSISNKDMTNYSRDDGVYVQLGREGMIGEDKSPKCWYNSKNNSW